MSQTIHPSVGNGVYSSEEQLAARIIASCVEPDYPGGLLQRTGDLGYYNDAVDMLLEPYEDIDTRVMIAARKGQAYEPHKAAEQAWQGLREMTGAATPYYRVAPLVDALLEKVQATPALPADVKRMPVYDKAGYVYCPNHRSKRLIRTKSGDAWRCPEFKCFYWQGEGYTEPSASAPVQQADGLELKTQTYIHSDQLSTIPRPTYLIDGLLVERGINVLYGASGCGKSFKVLDWCGMLSQDKRVMYVAAEDAGGYTARVEAWKEHNQLGTPGLLFWPQEVNTLIPAEVDAFIDEIAPLGLDLVVLDTLAACLAGGDDSSGDDMGMFLSACNKIRRGAGAATLVVHHTGKNGEYRGHSSLLGAADMFIRMEDRDGLKLLSWDKVKNGPKPEAPLKFRFEPVGETGSGVLIFDEDARAEKKNGLTQSQYKILETLSFEYFKVTGTTATNLVDITGISRSTIYNVLSTLAKKGLIQRGGRGDGCQITDKGKSTFIDAYEASRTRFVQFDGSHQEEIIQVVQVESKSESNSNPSPETMSYSKSSISLPLKGRNTLGLVGLSNQDAVEPLGLTESNPSPIVGQSKVDMSYLIDRYNHNDMKAIELHCAMHRANLDRVLCKLEAMPVEEGVI